MNAFCVTSDRSLRQALLRSLQASGSTVSFFDHIDHLPDDGTAALLFVDQDNRRRVSTGQLMQIIGENGKLVIVGDSLEDDDVVSLMRHDTFDHLMSEPVPDDRELVITTAKLTSGDIFGLEKYLPWGAKIHSQPVTSYEDKRAAIKRIAEYARELGARRHVVDRLENVADELMMNAIYDAPAVSRGGQPVQLLDGFSTGNLSVEPDKAPAEVRYASDGRYFALSVQDSYGELSKEAIIEHLVRARAEKGAPRTQRDDGKTGAGLGLFFVLSSVTRFIANIDRGRKTEVICMLDMKLGRREMKSCAESLHIFTT